ncbi:MAG: NfeD family protein [Gammaproteobacteria bacterium]|nr:NfeD family protein [Gammaproteobacteria bacterium]
MPWWGWMIFGAFLLGSELLGVDAGFYLVFIGLAAAMTGLLEVAGFELEPWVQWLTFAGFSLVLMVLFRKKLYAKLRGAGVGYDVGPAGEFIRMDQSLQSGESCRQSFRGTDWTVTNDGETDKEKGKRLPIDRVDGLTLIVNTGEDNDD